MKLGGHREGLFCRQGLDHEGRLAARAALFRSEGIDPRILFVEDGNFPPEHADAEDVGSSATGGGVTVRSPADSEKIRDQIFQARPPGSQCEADRIETGGVDGDVLPPFTLNAIRQTRPPSPLQERKRIGK